MGIHFCLFSVSISKNLVIHRKRGYKVGAT